MYHVLKLVFVLVMKNNESSKIVAIKMKNLDLNFGSYYQQLSVFVI